MSEGNNTNTHVNAAPDLWPACLDVLAQEIPEQQFNTWIRPLLASVSNDASKATIQVANRFKMDWVRTQYMHRIGEILSKLADHPVAVELVLTVRETPAKSGLKAPTVSDDLLSELPDVTLVASPSSLGGPKTRLNQALTFSTLVEGTANRMARAAAMHVAGSLGQLYNPLFIYGGVGLGKTHLMHAIGNILLSERPKAKVLYNVA